MIGAGVPVLVALAALLGVLSGASPTGLTTWDLVLSALLGALFVAFGSRCGARPLACVALLALLASFGSIWMVPAGVALVLAVRPPQSRRQLGAALSSMSALAALLFAGDHGVFGLSAALAAAALAVVLIFGRRDFAASSRRLVVQLAVVFGVALAAVVGSFAVAAADDADLLRESVRSVERGEKALRAGDHEGSRLHLELAAANLAEVDGRLHGWRATVVRHLPVLGQNLAAAQELVASGSALAQSGVQVLDATDPATIRPPGSAGVDLDAVRGLSATSAMLAETVDGARGVVAGLDSPWLVPPLAEAVNELAIQLDELADTTADASTLAEVMPEVLGASGPRRYLVLLGTPAEARELGGIAGGFLELVVDDGNITLERSVTDADLNRAGPVSFSDSGQFPVRYQLAEPGKYSQNYTSSPDFPTVADAVRQIYPQLNLGPSRSELDGVLYLDPFAIAALLEFGDAVDVPEAGLVLDQYNTADFLLKKQYRLLTDARERKAILVRIADQAFDNLISADASPVDVFQALRPLAAQGRLLVNFTDPHEADLLRGYAMAGEFERSSLGHDLLAVVHSNGGTDKLDNWMHRTVIYNVDYAPGNGALSATATVTLDNRAPLGLPDYVMGEDFGTRPALAPGTNAVLLSIYTPHDLAGVSVDGQTVGAEVQSELGLRRYLVWVEVQRATQKTVVFELEGSVTAADGDYHLDVLHQALVTDDFLKVSVKHADGTQVGTPGGSNSDNTSVLWSGSLRQDLELSAAVVQESNT